MRCLIVFFLASALLVVFASAAPTSTVTSTVTPSLDDKKSNEVTPGIDEEKSTDKKEEGEKSEDLKTTPKSDDKEGNIFIM